MTLFWLVPTIVVTRRIARILKAQSTRSRAASRSPPSDSSLHRRKYARPIAASVKR